MVFTEILSPERGIVAEDIALLRGWVLVTHLGRALILVSSSVEGLELSGVLHGSLLSLYDIPLHELGTYMHPPPWQMDCVLRKPQSSYCSAGDGDGRGATPEQVAGRGQGLMLGSVRPAKIL